VAGKEERERILYVLNFSIPPAPNEHVPHHKSSLQESST